MPLDSESVTVGLYGVSKRLRRYNYRNRWLRRDVLEMLCGKRRDDEWLHVLETIDLEIHVGEAVGIMGINGSGKSTLLKVIAGIYAPTGGDVIRRGTICTLMDVGTGFQDDLTGRENAFVNGAILGLSERYIRTALPEIVDFAELDGFLDTPIRYYSSGMRARLGFAVAMNAQPDIFLIDEVLAVGDEGFRRKCYARLDRLVSSGTTVIMVSHETEAMQRLCTRGVWLSGGRIRADGPMDEISRLYIEHFNLDGLMRAAV